MSELWNVCLLKALFWLASQNYKRLVTPEEPKTCSEECEDCLCNSCPALSMEQRVFGCIACIVVGVGLSIGSLFRLELLIEGNPVPFAVLYSIGNIISLCASCFFSGPCSQVKSMFASTRVIATMIYMTALILTLFFAFYNGISHRAVIIILLVIIQFLAFIWYTLSYIPYGREIISRVCASCCRVSTDL